MANPSPTQLDWNQALKQAYDDNDQSLRVNISTATETAIAISAADNDSVITYPHSVSNKASVTNASTGVIVPAFDCSGMKTFNLFTATTATITGAQVCTLEISPSDTDNVWIATSLTITPSGTNAVVVAGTAISSIARRARVSIAAAITTGTFDIYAVAQGV